MYLAKVGNVPTFENLGLFFGVAAMEILLLLGQVAAGLIGLVVAFFKTFKFVSEGELGIKLRFGKAVRNRDGAPKVINPGFVFLIPWVESLQRHHVRQQTMRFKNQKIMTKDGLIFNISAVVMYRVSNIYRALFEIENLDNSIADLSCGILRDVVSSREYHELANTKSISEELLHELAEKAEEWGVNFMQFKMVDCAPTAEAASLVIAAKGAELKATAICEAAKKLKINLSAIPPSLAAVLVGMPLVATTDVLPPILPAKNGKGDDEDGEGPSEQKPGVRFSFSGGD